MDKTEMSANQQSNFIPMLNESRWNARCDAGKHSLCDDLCPKFFELDGFRGEKAVP
jgi:hypothetical protein